MITSRAFELKLKHDHADTIEQKNDIANELIDELLHHCRPSPDEFVLVMNNTIVPALGFYKLIMHANGLWGGSFFERADEWARRRQVKIGDTE